MMAENSDIIVSEKKRQSKDSILDFSSGEDTSMPIKDARLSEDSCLRSECENINENQRQEIYSAGNDEGTSDMLPGKKNSISSINSTDSGYIQEKAQAICFNFE
ncbi:uncharacterized protein zgc:194007 [Megalobrama amblycephala]|uniref:uncharacterized protein zgc:194007 n=1 Tax=Megalobrama amblycephala TaxID=75352 RepID=UPI002013E5D1|nr:uncharacterized protein zgc:194007 [Megalobrama amblycephala]XP_048067247.1 uncharacterized protein zgc:194007 [Megalobrama amblycephala]